MSELYFHSKATPGAARVTIAARIDGQRVTFGAARCSLDDQFSKKKGRTLALGRATSKRPLKVATMPFENLAQWFLANAQEIATWVADDSRFLETK